MLEGTPRRIGSDDADRIETHDSATRDLRMLLHPGVRELPETSTLPLIDRLEGMTVRRRAPRLHLDDREAVTVHRDDVDLTLRASPVPSEHRVPAIGQVLCGAVFARSSEFILRCHDPSIASAPAL